MKHAALVRRQLGVRTVMNLLGPCINPARPSVQLLGVADPRMLRRIAQTLDAMGVEEALVVHGSGLDEVALHGETRALRLSNGAIEELEIVPEDAGLERAPLQTVKGGDVAENAARLKALLAGSGQPAEEDIVILNTAALLLTAGLADTLHDGAGQAREALLSGGGGRVLDRFIEASNGCSCPRADCRRQAGRAQRALPRRVARCAPRPGQAHRAQPCRRAGKARRALHPRDQEGIAIGRHHAAGR
jgi:anthranilate phosphoribosyltransferase